MNRFTISETIKKLEELREIYGDVRVTICSPYGEIDFIEEIFIDEFKSEIVVGIWS